ncbi:MAG: hypothetical protein GEV08_20700 [Acidimicrobiia bacterium]|nr:hypothetical protein [Acidimicrobiia bacterium]
MADDRKISDLSAEGDIDLDIDEDLTRADRGAVAVGDDIDDSAINTGRFEGIQNAGDGSVDAEEAVIGDGNITFNDSDVGAASFGRGDATNVEADNANLGDGTINDIRADNANVGDGTLTDVNTSGGGQTVVGSGNEVVGDVDVEFDDVSGNANFALGDDNQQLATQDNDSFIDQSTTDNSVELTSVDNSIDDSFNRTFEESFNTEQDLTSVVEDNDVFEDNDRFTDNSTFESEFESTEVDVDLERVDDTDLDVEA